MADALPALAEAEKSVSNRVMGCTSEAWIDVSLKADGKAKKKGASYTDRVNLMQQS